MSAVSELGDLGTPVAKQSFIEQIGPAPRGPLRKLGERSWVMVNAQTLQGSWNEVKGKLRSKWGQLTNDDVQQFNGNVDQLVGTIQRKTGEARSSIEKFLEDATANGSSMVSQATEAVRDYATHAAESLQEPVKQAADTMRKGYRDAEQMIKQRPGESAAVCFGVGIVVGLLLGLTMRR
jgi:uncharacterized protein YjbJ (UPF0337 family)